MYKLMPIKFLVGCELSVACALQLVARVGENPDGCCLIFNHRAFHSGFHC